MWFSIDPTGFNRKLRLKPFTTTQILRRKDLMDIGNIRKFTVIVQGEGNKGLEYPEGDGWQATKLMKGFVDKGQTVVARTTANGITEDLTYQEMFDIYDEFEMT
jgi:hypothetical protein